MNQELVSGVHCSPMIRNEMEETNIMNLKIFRCRCCGAKVEWNENSCPVCNRLVSNDRSKWRIIIGIITGVAVITLAVVILLHEL